MNIKKRKILHITGTMNIGGTETMIMNLYRELYKNYIFDFVYYSQEEGFYDDEIISLGGNIIKISDTSKVNPIKTINELYKVIRRGNYKIVHAHTLFNCGNAMIAAKLAGAEIRISHAHTNLEIGNSFIKKCYISIMKYLININSTNLFACSNSAGRYLFGDKVVSKNKYKVLPNYVDYKKFLKCDDENSIRKKLGMKSDDILVGHIGRFVDAKNHKFLIKVLNMMIKKDKRIKAILVGIGPLKNEIDQQIKYLGLENNIYLAGVRQDTEKILNNCDLFIFPSIYEGLGLVMLEAQSCGLPCLVSEAIQPEADLSIGLIKQLSLKDGIDKWSNEALNLIGSKNKDEKLINDAFINKGYNLENIINNLLNLYEV